MKEFSWVEFVISKVNIKRGDTVVIKVPGLASSLHSEQGRAKVEEYRLYTKKYLPPGVEVLMVDKELEIGVLGRDDMI